MLSLWWELLTRRWSCEGWDITPSTSRTQSSGRTRKLRNGEKQYNPLKVWLERNSLQRRVHVDQPACGRGRAWWGRERGAWPGSPCHQRRSWGNNDIKLREITNCSWLLPLGGGGSPMRIRIHFFVTTIKNHSLTAKTRFGHSLSFALYMCFVVELTRHGWIWQSAVGAASEC